MKGYTYPGKAPFKKEDEKDKPSGNEFFDMGRASGRVVTKSNFGDAVRASKIADKKNTTKIAKNGKIEFKEKKGNDVDTGIVGFGTKLGKDKKYSFSPDFREDKVPKETSFGKAIKEYGITK